MFTYFPQITQNDTYFCQILSLNYNFSHTALVIKKLITIAHQIENFVKHLSCVTQRFEINSRIWIYQINNLSKTVKLLDSRM